MPTPAMDRSETLFAEALQGGRHASISSEMLELMGKEAATKFLEQEIPLNESISKLAGEHADISSEQVKRVCEFANTSVYLARHDQAKTAGAKSSYPQFQLADPARVIQDLNDGAVPTITTETDIAYSRAAARPVEKTASVAGGWGNSSKERAWNELQKSFLGDGKTAATHSVDSVIDDVYAMKDSLTGTRDHLRVKGEQLLFMRKEAQAEYYELAKRHLLDGGSFTDLLAAAQSLPYEMPKIATVIGQLSESLVHDRVTSFEALQRQTNELEKVAHRVVNPQHPFVRTLGAIIDLDQESEKVSIALDEVDSHLSQVQAFIKEHFLAGASS